MYSVLYYKSILITFSKYYNVNDIPDCKPR